MRIACFGCISGDLFVVALLDSGVPLEVFTFRSMAAAEVIRLAGEPNGTP